MSAFLLPLLAAGAVALPEVDPAFLRRLTPSRSQAGGATFSLFVDPEGRVEQCQVLDSDYPLEAVERSCERTVGRKVKVPALDVEGQPVFGVLELSVYKSYSSSSSGAPPELPHSGRTDLTLQVEKLPSTDLQSPWVAVTVLLDEVGAVEHCQTIPAYDQRLSNVACQQVRQHQFGVRSGPEGNPVRYVRTLKVEFLATAPAE